jgi:hypothetical protein
MSLPRSAAVVCTLGLLVAACGGVSPLGVDGGGQGGMSGRMAANHRPAAITCPTTPRPAGSCTSAMASDGGLSCNADSDCKDGLNGRCMFYPRVASTCACTYDSCTTDADCKLVGGPCVCRADGQAILPPGNLPTNACFDGNCRVDADCGAGGSCSPSLGPCGNYGGLAGYYCHTANDKCVDDSDCATQGGGDCRYNVGTKLWACSTSQCVG